MQYLLTRKKYLISLTVYLLLAGSALAITPFIGSERVDVHQVIEDLKGAAVWSTDTDIFIYQRVPRVLMGFLAGGALAVVGGVFQVILRNPLATPYTLGVTGGSSVGAVLAISIPGWAVQLGPFTTVQVFSLVGAVLAAGFIYLMARRQAGISMNTLLLAGVTVGILCGALIQLIIYLSNPHLMMTMVRWMIGGLDVIGYRELSTIFILLAPGLGMLFIQMASYNHLALGEEMATGHGVDVGLVQRMSFLGGSMATAAVVAVTGPIIFVGLLVPHAVRRISGYDHRVVLPGSFLAGGALLVVCDTAARTVLAPTEMPVGIITAVLGGPVFIYLLLKKK